MASEIKRIKLFERFLTLITIVLKEMTKQIARDYLKFDIMNFTIYEIKRTLRFDIKKVTFDRELILNKKSQKLKQMRSWID